LPVAQADTFLRSVPNQNTAASPAASGDVASGIFLISAGHQDVIHIDEHEIHASSKRVQKEFADIVKDK
jgi:hypothetical protein